MFEGVDQNGETVSSKELAGRPYVIYFYPHDDTPICTRQACGFQEGIEAFRELDAQVIGVSMDDLESHKAFAEKYDLEFPLLADPKGRIMRDFDARGVLGRAQRVTYLVDGRGVVRGVRRHEFSGKGHMEWARKKLQELTAAPGARNKTTSTPRD